MKLAAALLFSVALLLAAEARAAGCDGAGNCYVYAAATGSGTGTDWTDAYTGFGAGAHQVDPSNMQRGVTYWIAAGSYGGVTFGTADNGASVISLEAAIPGAHGPATDWSDGFAGQALFAESSITTDDWTFNGQSRGADWQSGYNLKFWNQTDTTGSAVVLGGAHVSFSYVELQGTTTIQDNCSTDSCGTVSDSAIYNVLATADDQNDDLYVGYCYAHHTGNTQFQLNSYAHDGATFEYNWVAHNHTGNNGIHDEAFSIYWSDLVVRYNVFQDICGSGIITTAGGGAPALSNWDVYGNLFFWDATYAANNGQYQLGTLNNAMVDFLGEQMSGHIYFANNTIAGFNDAVVTASGSGFSTLAISGSAGYSTGNPTVVIEDNLWWNSAYACCDFAAYGDIVTGATVTEDYDAFFQGSVPAGAFQNPTESHAQVVSTSTDPFVDSSASTIAGFQLAMDTQAGSPLVSPYDLDGLDGVQRGADGTWDRGAEQLAGDAGVTEATTSGTTGGTGTTGGRSTTSGAGTSGSTAASASSTSTAGTFTAGTSAAAASTTATASTSGGSIKPSAGGCGCSSARPDTAVSLLFALGLLALRRRAGSVKPAIGN